MTTLCFRVDEAVAATVDEWAGRLQVGRLELLREALQRHLAALAADQDVHAYTEQPITKDETSFAEIADWGPAHDGWAGSRPDFGVKEGPSSALRCQHTNGWNGRARFPQRTSPGVKYGGAE